MFAVEQTSAGFYSKLPTIHSGQPIASRSLSDIGIALFPLKIPPAGFPATRRVRCHQSNLPHYSIGSSRLCRAGSGAIFWPAANRSIWFLARCWWNPAGVFATSTRMLQKTIRSLDEAKRNPGRKEALFALRPWIALRFIQATNLQWLNITGSEFEPRVHLYRKRLFS